MSNTSVSQGIYSPLPQILTDSESEEELHSVVGSQNRTKNMKEAQEAMKSNGLVDFQRFGNSQELDETNGYAVGHNEMVRILPGDKDSAPMSNIRRFFFVLSILFCFSTVVVFLWVLPCSEYGRCSDPSAAGRRKSSWENPYHGMELKGGINIVDGAPGYGKNLVLLFRGDIINPDRADGVRTSSGNGVVSIVGHSGKVAWFIRQPRLPTEIDCDLLDVQADTTKDCVVVGEDGLFATFGPLTGTVHWYLHSRDGNSVFPSVDFPLIMTDVDGDDVKDMVVVCTPEKGASHNALIFVSGRRGSVIGDPFVVSECQSISKLQLDADHMLSFTCRYNSTSESLRVATFEEVFRKITNRQLPPKMGRWPVSRQHRIFGQRKETENQRNIYAVDGRKLIVENRGPCPKNCRVTVQLVDERNGSDSVSWEYTAARVYGMVPATLAFNNNAALKSPIAGFVLKFWQWNAAAKGTNRFDRDADSNTYDIFESRRPSSDGSGSRKGPSTRSLPKKDRNVTVNHLTERVVLVTFNSTDVHIVNASQSDVVQMCLEEGEEPVCQPDMTFQENSLMITDLDGDGDQELITYLTTFVCQDSGSVEEYYGEVVKCDTDWSLRSTVRIVRLEAELPKLYEAVSHH